jgi:mono/diheme cytochrome c family protein
MKRVLKWIGISLAGLLSLAAVAVAVGSSWRYDAPFPALHASSDPAVIERGRYLAHGPAHCVTCHGDPAQKGRKDADLTGGMVFDLPIGTFRPANLTPDTRTGIGASSDAELARALRYGVARDGHAMFPFMAFTDLSNDDLVAVLSYLRSRRPVERAVRQVEFNVLGRVIQAALVRPAGPTMPVRDHVTPGPTPAYGRYLVESVGNCAGCHTNRNPVTAAMEGATLAGGLHIESDSHPGVEFVTPNLTPDPETGRVAKWTEELFVARFQMGRGAEGTPMPWAEFGNMTDDDLRAIFRYLQSVPAVKNDTGPSVSGPAAVTASR